MSARPPRIAVWRRGSSVIMKSMNAGTPASVALPDRSSLGMMRSTSTLTVAYSCAVKNFGLNGAPLLTAAARLCAGVGFEEVRAAPSAGAHDRRVALLVGLEAAIVGRLIVEETPGRRMRAAPGSADQDNESEGADQLLHQQSPLRRLDLPSGPSGAWPTSVSAVDVAAGTLLNGRSPSYASDDAAVAHTGNNGRHLHAFSSKPRAEIGIGPRQMSQD